MQKNVHGHEIVRMVQGLVKVKQKADMVFDEADMLLCRGFENHVVRLIHMLRFDEKLLSRLNKSGLDNPVESNSVSVSHFDLKGEEDIQNKFISVAEEMSEDDVDAEDLTEENKTSPVKKKDWRRVRKNYERSKQYIFVAATRPVNGKIFEAVWYDVIGGRRHLYFFILLCNPLRNDVETEKDHSCYKRTTYIILIGSSGIVADFATSAVDFLHRVGRTARAGQFGVITSLYNESNQYLVNAIRSAGKLRQPVVIEKVFSFYFS
ncbi:DEAD-box ATP-dependent RNA helicase 22 [Hibiscus syriacus]|uniref:DEAD-box ATP-dependent RNA helicase 22 n=1 Tax=Hibiscus syriacus TaxID=106335 RepID=A0A6A3C0R3_HIBSY|nr:DEAD-box ATP-dependent RNA helicase 22 [Hibiscus syriacus]